MSLALLRMSSCSQELQWEPSVHSYYGSKLSPHALLLAKPLANMGNVARNERILRAGGFATSLDILMKNYDNLSDEAIEQLNNRMWDRFDSADWSQNKVHHLISV